MNRSRIKHTATAIVACATVAAVVGIATGAAAPSSNNSDSNGNASGPPAQFGTAIGPPPAGAAFSAVTGGKGRRATVVIGGPGPGGPGAFGGPPVHSEMVVPNRAGDDFITVTQDNGKVNSVSGSQLTITEGTDKATYKTVTLDIPSDAKVVRDGDKAALSDLQAGDQVHVSQSPDNSFVFATDSQFQKKMLKQFREHFKNLPKPPSVLPGGPPPGLPPEVLGRRGN
jgi:hypothetical protein